ncbi:MAG: GtrA family protein [Pseudomonadota bacterium]
MFDFRSVAEWNRIWRYYQAGIVNTVFGYGLFVGFVWLGLNLYLAQIVSHVLGVMFNYFTYSRYAFADHQASKRRFAASYAGNYLLGLAALAAAASVVGSPYVAGLISTVFVSLVNYFVLKRLVFSPKPAG